MQGESRSCSVLLSVTHTIYNNACKHERRWMHKYVSAHVSVTAPVPVCLLLLSRCGRLYLFV